MREEISAERIMKDLGTGIIGRSVLYLPETGSTNEVARAEARAGAAEGTAVVAGLQTGGKGRLKRTWRTPEGNIALSVILRPPKVHLPQLIMVSSLAVVRAIGEVTGLEARIKWPNDVLIGGKKVCGILIENDLHRGTVNFSVIGIGINISFDPADYPDIYSPATGLEAEAGGGISRVKLIRSLLRNMEKLYLSLGEDDAVYDDWKKSVATLNSRVTVSSEDEVLEGLAEDIGRDGSLMVRTDDGTLHRVFAGDVTLRREN